MKDVAFLLPAYNEELSIGSLIENIRELYYDSNIIVIDNNSSDRTSEIALKLDAEVIFEKKQGKSHAIQKGFKHTDSRYVIMLDADNTYDPKDARKLLEPLQKGEADLVLGSRLKGEKEKGAISKTNIIGNHILSLIARILYHPVSDVCTGYWAFNKEVVDYLLDVGIECSGFEVEAEMFVKVVKGEFRIKEIPISYKTRPDETKLSSFRDGYKILSKLLGYELRNFKAIMIVLGFFAFLLAAFDLLFVSAVFRL